MKNRLPYWISPLRFGEDASGPYIAVDIATERKSTKTTVYMHDAEVADKTPLERSKIIAKRVHEKAKELGFIPKEWALK